MIKPYSDWLCKVADLVEAGKLPYSAVPRLFFCGHKPIGEIEGEELYRCVACGTDSKTRGPETNTGYSCAEDYSAGTCVKCGNSKELYEITEREYRWECKSCEHQWTADDGRVCPECGDKRD